MVCLFVFFSLALSLNSAYWQEINDAPDMDVGSN